MRVIIFGVIVAMGMAIGLLLGLADGWTTGVGMTLLGAMFAAPVAGALTGIGQKARKLAPYQIPDWEESVLPKDGMSANDLDANYWRDKGHPPFMKPPEFIPEKNDFDYDQV